MNFTGWEYQPGLLYERYKENVKAMETMDMVADKDEYLSLVHFYLWRKYSAQRNYSLAQSHFDQVRKHNQEFLEFQIRQRQKSED